MDKKRKMDNAEYHRIRSAAYRKSEVGQEKIKAYNASPIAKEMRDRYRKSERGKEISRQNEAKRKDDNRRIVVAAKSTPCADCGLSFDPICMDFHHLRDKKYQIGWNRLTTKSLISEMQKCIVLCSCCHRLRHKQKR